MMDLKKIDEWAIMSIVRYEEIKSRSSDWAESYNYYPLIASFWCLLNRKRIVNLVKELEAQE